MEEKDKTMEDIDMDMEAAKAAAKVAEELETEADVDDKETDEESSETESSDDSKDESKSDKKDPKDEKIAELTDRVMRTAAEFDNFRKRSEKEKASMYDFGVKTTIEKLLPTIDNFERGLASVPDDKEAESFAEGMKMIYKQMLKELEEIGVTPIECVGKEFDPNLHNAVMHEEDDSGEVNIVSEELQKGYMYKDMVVRHSMVKVKN